MVNIWRERGGVSQKICKKLSKRENKPAACEKDSHCFSISGRLVARNGISASNQSVNQQIKNSFQS